MAVITRKLMLIAVYTGLTCQSAYPETVYVCEGEGEGGSTLYSEKPCKNSEGVTMHFPDSYSVGEGLSDLEKRNLSAIEAREREKKKSREPDATPSPENPTLSDDTTPVDEAACDDAKARLEKWEKVIDLGYPPEDKEYYLEELQKRKEYYNESCGLAEN